LKGIILQHFAFCPPVHYILLIEHRFKTLVSNGKHIYDEQGNCLWNGMLFSSKKHFYLIFIYMEIFVCFIKQAHLLAIISKLGGGLTIALYG
jgi:hypothetical protein